MKTLIADDDAVSRLKLEVSLKKWGHEVVVAADGSEAWQALQADDPPRLAILDWMMPGMDGVDVCRRIRTTMNLQLSYIILLTARGTKAHVIEGLKAGANDYVTKPFDQEELRARVTVGAQMVRLQLELAERVRELEDALARVNKLQGLLPICSYCKKIRDDGDYWHQVEHYIASHSAAQFSHGICPNCWESVVVPELQAFKGKEKQQQGQQ